MTTLTVFAHGVLAVIMVSPIRPFAPSTPIAQVSFDAVRAILETLAPPSQPGEEMATESPSVGTHTRDHEEW